MKKPQILQNRHAAMLVYHSVGFTCNSSQPCCGDGCRARGANLFCDRQSGYEKQRKSPVSTGGSFLADWLTDNGWSREKVQHNKIIILIILPNKLFNFSVISYLAGLIRYVYFKKESLWWKPSLFHFRCYLFCLMINNANALSIIYDGFNRIAKIFFSYSSRSLITRRGCPVLH